MHPLLRASLTSGTLYGVGDQLNQRLFGSTVDWDQTRRFMTVGFVCHGPYFLGAFRVLDRICGTSRQFSRVIMKAYVGQFTVFPPFVAIMLGATAWLDSRDPWKAIQTQFIPVNLTGLFIWPPFSIINFRWVPSQYRILYINCVGIGWNAYCSYVAHHSKS